MLAPEFFPVWGGVGTYIIELVRHLPKNIDVHVLTPERTSFGKQKIDKVNFSQYFGSNVHVHFISAANDTFFYNAKFQRACLTYVPKLVKEEKIELIHSHTAQMPDLLLMFRKMGKPFVTTVHTTIKSQRLATRYSDRQFGELEKSEQATCIMYPFLRLAEAAYFKHNRFLISPSRWMMQLMRKDFSINSNIRVIPNSVDFADYTFDYDFSEKSDLSILNDYRIILFVGRLLALKGVDCIIESMPAVIQKLRRENLLFVFAGPGDQERYLKKIKAMNLSSYALFTGPLSRESIIHLIKKSELLVAPSFTENSPYTILEAMACGKPVVATRVGGIPEIIQNGDNGILIDQKSSQMLADSIINLLENKDLQLKLSQNATKTIAKNFSWTSNLSKYLELYEEIISLNIQGDC